VAGELRIRVDGHELTFDGSRPVVIGRLATSDVLLSHARASRTHGTLTPGDDGWTYTDSSGNGTYLDGARIERLPITGPVTLRMGDPEAGDAVELRPAAQPAAPAPETAAAEPVPPPPVPVTTAATPPPEVPMPQPVSSATPREGDRVRIGRQTDNDLVIADPLVSRHHAELRRSAAGSVEIVDVGSHNGTFVNGARVQRAELHEGDVVSIGSRPLRYVAGRLLSVEEPLAMEAEGLTVRLPDGRVILDDVSVDIAASSLIAIIGPSGCGKSTLMNALSGLHPATQGEVRYGSLDLYRSHELLRRRLGFVPQSDILHTQLTVRKALGYAAELRFSPDVSAAERDRRVQEVMEELDIAERADVPIRSLSGGQRKRTSVALELLTKPALLFLDEPTSGLDPGNEQQLMRTLRDLADGGRIVVVVTHSLQSIELCDRVLFLAEGGRLAYYGPPAEAMAYFAPSVPAADDLVDVFAAVEEAPGTDWKGGFRASPAYTRYVTEPLGDVEVRTAADEALSTPPKGHSWVGEFRILTRRYVSVILADRGTALLLAIQAPLLGLLLFFAVGLHDNFDTRNGILATFTIWLVVIGATWLGASNSIREIVKERAILRRERLVGLSLGPYLASKVAVLGSITVIQALVLAGIALWRQSIPALESLNRELIQYNVRVPVPRGGGAALGSQALELYLVVCLVGLAAMTLGLAVSAAVRTSDQALIWLPLVLVAQVVASIPSFGENPVSTVLGKISCANWGTAAVGSTMDLATIRSFADTVTGNIATIFHASVTPTSTVDERWVHDAAHWWPSFLMLLALTAVGAGFAWLFLRRGRGGDGAE
jgi:ABC-type multidrug transport system ATPase subunit/pSer/pThr/pTyr-binding forkhead associated (FHA) protein